MIADAALGLSLGFINHLIADESWAQERLKPFASKRARLEIGAFRWPLQVSSEGLFVADDKSEAPDVTITLATDAPLRVLTESASLLASAQISGSAELAENLAFVFRNLRWDVENDVAFFVGDIAARRIVNGGKRFLQWQREAAKNLALNLAEYLTEESRGVARKEDLAAFCAAIDGLLEHTSRLEQRLEKLESAPPG